MSTFKLDGAKFPTLEELKEALWPMHQDQMSKEEFEKYVEQNVQKAD